MSDYYKDLQKVKADKLNKIQQMVFINNNLMWQDETLNKEKKLNRLEFKVYCRNLELANRNDWRVPTYDELLTLVDYNKIVPASLDKIQYIIPSIYWTSTQDIRKKDKNWFVDFRYGTSDTSSDLKRHYIRCVRDISTKKGTY